MVEENEACVLTICSNPSSWPIKFDIWSYETDMEADALGCLVSVTKQDETNPPAVILAGDPKQLGPIIRSDVCKTFGLEKSFLERLSLREAYARRDETDDLGNHYDRRMTTKLVHNYRSHPTILDLPNRAFYDGDLIADADITVSHRFVGWEHLPTRGFPIVFHGIEGEDTREQNSPSWFNPDEAQIVKMYVELLVKDTKQNKCKPEDIGIITPNNWPKLLRIARKYNCRRICFILLRYRDQAPQRICFYCVSGFINKDMRKVVDNSLVWEFASRRVVTATILNSLIAAGEGVVKQSFSSSKLAYCMMWAGTEPLSRL